jgi:5-methyltetrahydrofolate--homocysteine methyltransferase
MIIVGERLNSSRKNVLEALVRRDEQFLLDQAANQEKAGASYIDLNAAALIDAEIPTLQWAIPLLQKKIRIPLSLDTPNPQAMEAALNIHQGRALLNSLSGDAKCLREMIPLIRDYRPRVIALCLDESGPPQSADHALSKAERMVGLLAREGVSPEDIFIDPLVRPIGVDSNSGALFLESVERIKKNLPDVKTIAGLSNVSFGLPQRRQLNRTFLALALSRGLDAAICDPLDDELQATLHAAQALLGKDPSLKKYLKAFRERTKSVT